MNFFEHFYRWMHLRNIYLQSQFVSEQVDDTWVSYWEVKITYSIESCKGRIYREEKDTSYESAIRKLMQATSYNC
jgi:hypothetical protein